jgi:predicted RNase H-like HicB family nuclease
MNLPENLNAALEGATYEEIDDPEPYYGEIPGIQGVWATGATLEDCRQKLREALEDWVSLST